jgi:hypothetical protein
VLGRGRFLCSRRPIRSRAGEGGSFGKRSDEKKTREDDREIAFSQNASVSAIEARFPWGLK